MKANQIIRILLDIVVIYAYLFWPIVIICHLAFSINFTELIVGLPYWARILIGIIFVLPVILIPVTLWMYAMGKSDELKNRREGNQIYYIGAWLGEIAGFLYYWRYIRTGIDQDFCNPLSRILKDEQIAGGNE